MENNDSPPELSREDEKRNWESLMETGERSSPPKKGYGWGESVSQEGDRTKSVFLCPHCQKRFAKSVTALGVRGAPNRTTFTCPGDEKITWVWNHGDARREECIEGQMSMDFKEK